MSVQDHASQVISKAAVNVGPGTNAEYAFRTQSTGTATISGEVTAVGFKVEQRNTTLLITDVATKIPATPLSGRNQVSIQNLSATNTLYIGKSDVTADSVAGTTSGWPVGPNESLNELVQDDVEYWGRAETGKSFLVIVRELA